jgi:hypothetical protein
MDQGNPHHDGDESDHTPRAEILDNDEAATVEGGYLNPEGETVATTDSIDGISKGSVDKAPAKPKRSKAEKEEAKERMLIWARGLKVQDVVLTKDGEDVDTVGPRKWAELSAAVKEAFMKANNISKSQSLRLSSQLGKNVANHINSQGFKDKIKTTLRSTSKSKRTKPNCVTMDGTLYRAINVIILKKELYVQTKDSHDQEDQDTRNPKPVAWQTLHECYESDLDALKVLSPAARNALVGFSVLPDICNTWDDLDYEEFEQVVTYLGAVYRECRNKKNVSGEHDQFGAYVGGRHYLLYFHECLVETGDKALQDCAYAELGDGVKRCSTDPPKRKIKRGSSNATERSLTPPPNSTNFRSRKNAAMEATEEAAAAMAERQYEMNQTNKFDRMMQMRSDYEKETMRADALKKKYKTAKREFDSVDSLTDIRKRYKIAKKNAKIYLNEYEKLKEKMGYESPASSEDSLSSNSHKSDDGND